MKPIDVSQFFKGRGEKLCNSPARRAIFLCRMKEPPPPPPSALSHLCALSPCPLSHPQWSNSFLYLSSTFYINVTDVPLLLPGVTSTWSLSDLKSFIRLPQYHISIFLPQKIFFEVLEITLFPLSLLYSVLQHASSHFPLSLCLSTFSPPLFSTVHFSSSSSSWARTYLG